jgi:ribosomal protein L37AE/L43A
MEGTMSDWTKYTSREISAMHVEDLRNNLWRLQHFAGVAEAKVAEQAATIARMESGIPSCSECGKNRCGTIPEQIEEVWGLLVLRYARTSWLCPDCNFRWTGHEAEEEQLHAIIQAQADTIERMKALITKHIVAADKAGYYSTSINLQKDYDAALNPQVKP